MIPTPYLRFVKREVAIMNGNAPIGSKPRRKTINVLQQWWVDEKKMQTILSTFISPTEATGEWRDVPMEEGK